MSRNRHKIYKPPQSDPELEKIAEQVVTVMTPDHVTHKNFDGGSSHEVHVAMKIRTQAISIGLPMDELMFAQFLMNFVGLHLMPWDQLITTTSTYLPSARNAIHKMFLESPDTATHLLMLDSDVLPPPNIIETLLAHKKDMVGGWYRKKEKYPVKSAEDGMVDVIQRPVVYDNVDGKGFVQRMYPGTGLEQVAGAGAGCWMMSRELAQKLGPHPYGEDCGEDLVICQKIIELGVPMFIDWDIPCGHCGVFFV